MNSSMNAVSLAAPDPSLIQPVRARRNVGRIGRVVLFSILVIGTAMVAILGVGGIVGRWRFLPAPEAAPNAHAPANSLLMLVPVPAAKIGRRDLVVLTPNGSGHARVYRVRAVVSPIDHTVEVTDQHGVETALHLPATTWRVSREVPVIGRVIRTIPGSALSWLLILAGIGALAFARFRPTGRRSEPS
jgi:hypothetical protein